ncbi:MAG: MFS transporter [Lentisphaeria bacterium]|nr:MFS transporter [Lentisphaeria bacterium]
MSSPKTYKCGSLEYTMPQLVMVGFWLLFGGFVLSLGISMPSRLLPIQLQELGVSDKTRMLLLSTIGGILNMTVCPYIGFVSDRHRGRWGRRIPYLFKSMPPIAISLILFGLSGQFGGKLASMVAPWWQSSPATMTVLVISATMMLFQFFRMWSDSVIWYIFNDIIPPVFFGRIMALYNIGNTLSVALFNYFVFPYARHHSTVIYIATGILYAIGISLLCYFVREGTYPPVEDSGADEPKSFVGFVKNSKNKFMEFLKESFCHRLYVLKYLLATVQALAGTIGIYYFYFFCEIGFSDAEIGHMEGIKTIISTIGMMIATVLASQLVNRWHPVRITFYSVFLSLSGTMILGLKYLFGTLPPTIYMIFAIVVTGTTLFSGALTSICGLPTEMMVFPKSRFGSFCSMQALLRSTITTILGLGVAAFFDFLAGCYPEHPEFRYRYVPAFALPCCILVFIVAYFFFREWQKLGGYDSYKCPASWEKDGFEKLDMPKPTYMTGRNARRTLILFDLCFAIATIAFAVYPQAIGFLRPSNVPPESIIFWPMVQILLTDVVWFFVRRKISKNARAAEEAGETVKYGLHPMAAFVFFLTQYGTIAAHFWCCYYSDGIFEKAGLNLSAASLLALVIILGVLNFLERKPKEA